MVTLSFIKGALRKGRKLMEARKKFDYSKDPGPGDAEHLKCYRCGLEREWDRNVSYKSQANCPVEGCRGLMLSWDWRGWKATPERQARWEELKRRQNEARERATSQESEPFENFTEPE